VEDVLPFVRVAVSRSSSYNSNAIQGCIHKAMVEVLHIPEGDHFQVISHHESWELVYDKSFLGIERTDGIIFIQITLAAGRDAERKKALYGRIATLLCAECGVRPEDVFITLLEIPPENFSFGSGQAQFADLLPPHLSSPATFPQPRDGSDSGITWGPAGSQPA
jgi:4-oxalocrotonate tautomerase